MMAELEEVGIKTQTCKHCKVDKPFEDFPKGRQTCKPCFRKQANSIPSARNRKEWYAKKKETDPEWYAQYMDKQKIKYQRYKDRANEKRRHNRKNNLNTRLKNNLRCRLYAAIKIQGAYKQDTVLNLIGCSIDFLKGYLTEKMQQGMSWQNHGKWHIDHIIPCAAFDLTHPQEQRKCFHYSNLQPLWATDNLQKSDKITVTNNKKG